jgi:lysophospholipase L1-like esterase
MAAEASRVEPTITRFGKEIMRSLAYLVMMSLIAASLQSAQARDGENWVVSWTGSDQGPYPVGNPSAQPDQTFAFPEPATGARDQTFRLMVRPDLWGRQARIRLSNSFGTKPVTFDGTYVGLQWGSAALVRGSNRPVTFGGKASVTIPPGNSAWSDPVTLPFVRQPVDLAGRRLAVSFHIAGDSGPMTWHAKAMTTSYVTAPGAGAKGALEDEAAFPYATTSWFFLDAIEMIAPADAFAIIAFGDSITDGTGSTMNGDDRWADVLSRRLKALYGNKVAVVNGGIGGNQIAGPPDYGPDKPYAGGPASGQRLDRDVLSLSGISSLIWLEGINDFSKNGNAPTERVIAAMKDGVARLRAKWPNVRVVGATLTSALGSSSAAHGFPEQDAKRKELNDFIRTSGTFDAVIDFNKAVIDPQSGGLKQEFVPESTTGGPGDKLHPNRTGYQAMGHTIDLDLFKPVRPNRSAKLPE